VTESVWDYPRPPRVEPVSKRIHVVFGDILGPFKGAPAAGR